MGGGGEWLGRRRLVGWNGEKGCGVRAWWVRGGHGPFQTAPRSQPSGFACKGRIAGPKRRRPVPPDGADTTTRQPGHAAQRTRTSAHAKQPTQGARPIPNGSALPAVGFRLKGCAVYPKGQGASAARRRGNHDTATTQRSPAHDNHGRSDPALPAVGFCLKGCVVHVKGRVPAPPYGAEATTRQPGHAAQRTRTTAHAEQPTQGARPIPNDPALPAVGFRLKGCAVHPKGWGPRRPTTREPQHGNQATQHSAREPLHTRSNRRREHGPIPNDPALPAARLRLKSPTVHHKGRGLRRQTASPHKRHGAAQCKGFMRQSADEVTCGPHMMTCATCEAQVH